MVITHGPSHTYRKEVFKKGVQEGKLSLAELARDRPASMDKQEWELLLACLKACGVELEE